MVRNVRMKLVRSILLIMVLLTMLTGCDKSNSGTQNGGSAQPTPATEVDEVDNSTMSTAAPTVSPYAHIESKYIKLQYPLELTDIILHEHDTYEARYTDAFYMKHDEEDISLFRFDFGDESAGDWNGLLKTDSGDIAVTSIMFTLSEEEYEALTEEAKENYSACMQAYSIMLEGIMADPNFTSERPLAVGENSEVKTAYWTLTLPDNMTVTETSENGTYKANFYGEVAGARTALYTVHIGDDKLDIELGLYEMDSVKKLISVGMFDLSEKANWTDDDYSTAYRMMETVNHVIETIMSSEKFSALSEDLGQDSSDAQNPETEVSVAANKEKSVNTIYWNLTLPVNMTIEETTENDAYVATFYGEVAGESTALYLVHIGNNKHEIELGLYEVDGVKKPISVGVFDLSEKANWTEDDYSAAYRMMDTINHVIETIMSSEQFSVPAEESIQEAAATDSPVVETPLAVGEDTAIDTTYWNLTLPSNMTVKESTENNTYIATFHGEVAGERVALYTVHIGDDKAESELGLYEVDGIKKPVSVEVFDLSDKVNWTDDDYSAAYRMMDTINYVIETIMSSEQFFVSEAEL